MKPREHWAVMVYRNGEAILTIESNSLSGRELTPEDERVVRHCGEHLLAFVGTSTPPPTTEPLALATEAESKANPPCLRCGGPHPFDMSLPSPAWNGVIRAFGLPDYLCPACIIEQFGMRGISFNCELWGGPFNGMPLAVHFNSRRARGSQQLVAENNELRYRLAEAERACKTFREQVLAQATSAPEAIPTPETNGCINCGEANDGGFYTAEGNVGSFCSQCWDLIRDDFVPTPETKE